MGGTSGCLLVLVPSLRVGGTERQVVELMAGLQAESRPAVLALLAAEGDLLASCRARGVVPIDLGAYRWWNYPRALGRLHGLIRDHRPDAVYSLLSPANFIASAYGLANRKVRIVWGIRSDKIAAERSGLSFEVARTLTAMLGRRANGFIVNARAATDALVALGMSQREVRFVPNATDTARFRPDPQMREACRKELGLEPNVPVVVCVARLVPTKRHGDLLRAFIEVRRQIPNAVLLLVGDGEPDYVAGLLRVAKELPDDAVRFLGERRDVERLFNAADVAVLMSRNEGFPNTIAEALACGAPCVATRVGEADALVAPEDLVDVGDAAAAARAMCRLLSARGTSPRRSLLPDGYTRDRLVSNTIAAIESLANPTQADQP